VYKGGPLIAFTAYLDEVNNASGSRSTLAVTHAANVSVPTAAPNNTMWYVLIGVVVLLALLVVTLTLLWRRHKRHGGEPPAPATT
jgi:LPXTG-motif cell wall-anchored protein